ncbi:hypothetical protein HMPREF0322_00887 [Desulfitobacterium hafniense DP7]|uniref:Uncharacterized protein n=1 Tax=Desulfitobacterium hafniense DP7 TaxID=537010 RepID=G9XIW1_DESHA|nr:hypothetical protein HMPREF0322_00887 [Desulfitobacterium hafniense DP7]
MNLYKNFTIQFSSIFLDFSLVMTTLAADFVLHYNQRKGKCQGKKGPCYNEG